MKISEAKYEAGKLILTASPAEAIGFAYRFKAGDYEIKPIKAKRSLDANAYAWALIDKIAAAVRVAKSEVYRNAVRDMGGNFETGLFEMGAAEELKAIWEANGLGWQALVEPLDSPKGWARVSMYYGSSVFTVEEMSIFIDGLIQEAQALGIETMQPEKLASLLEAWNGKQVRNKT